MAQWEIIQGLVENMCSDVTTNEGFFKPDNIRLIGSGIQQQIAQKSLCLEGSYTFSTAASTEEYNLPADFFRVQPNDYGEPNIRCGTYLLTEFSHKQLDTTDRTGQPRNYYIRNKKIGLYPIPTSTQTVTLYYYRTPPGWAFQLLYYRTGESTTKAIVNVQTNDITLRRQITSGVWMTDITNTFATYNTLTLMSNRLYAESNIVTAHTAVDLVATSNIAVTGSVIIDSVASGTKRILCTAQTSTIENGLWVAGAGAWTRPTDWDTAYAWTTSDGFTVSSGTLYAGTIWMCTNAGATGGVGTDSPTITFTGYEGAITFFNSACSGSMASNLLEKIYNVSILRDNKHQGTSDQRTATQRYRMWLECELPDECNIIVAKGIAAQFKPKDKEWLPTQVFAKEYQQEMMDFAVNYRQRNDALHQKRAKLPGRRGIGYISPSGRFGWRIP